MKYICTAVPSITILTGTAVPGVRNDIRTRLTLTGAERASRRFHPKRAEQRTRVGELPRYTLFSSCRSTSSLFFVLAGSNEQTKQIVSTVTAACATRVRMQLYSNRTILV